jgi:integrase
LGVRKFLGGGIVPLTDLAIRRIKGADRPYKLADSNGLYLLVQPNGSRLWRHKFRFAGKEKSLAYGQYPEVSLAEARERRDDARRLLRRGVDPAAKRREAKRDARISAAAAFEAVAREWHEIMSDSWTDNHAGYVMRRLEADAFPTLGARPVIEVTASEVLDVLRKVERRGARELAHRLLQSMSAVFRYAIATDRAKSDPTRDLRGALKPVQHGNFAALDEKDLPEFMRRLSTNDARMFVRTRLALELLMRTFVRTGELIGARWEEFDLAKGDWSLPAGRMKRRREHIVPLATQVIELLTQLRAFDQESEFLFPGLGRKNATMSNNTVLAALERMGYKKKMTGHGFRALASTILNAQGFNPEAIERQLAHVERNKTRAAYNRNPHLHHLPERRRMMQHWSDYLDGIARGANVVPIRRTTGD